uniref:Uncharacterized protein n=1 Tax=Arundo donax TaxID=35708 RepID=A0A0A9A2M9_ARUDO
MMSLLPIASHHSTTLRNVPPLRSPRYHTTTLRFGHLRLDPAATNPSMHLAS